MAKYFAAAKCHNCTLGSHATNDTNLFAYHQ